MYSTPWKIVKTIAKNTVATNPYNVPPRLPCINEWWAYVTVTPDDSNRIVLSKGSSKGFIASIPIGGHWAPNSTVGDNALWKKAQNIAKKNNASDTINKATPMFNPLCTANVWLPKYVPSLITSRHQNDMDKIRETSESVNILPAKWKAWKVETALVVKVSSETDVYIGQGEGDTRWKGWAWKLLLVWSVMFLFDVNSSLSFAKESDWHTKGI